MTKTLYASEPSQLRTLIRKDGTSSLQGWYQAFGGGTSGEWRDIDQKEASYCICQHVQIVEEK